MQSLLRCLARMKTGRSPDPTTVDRPPDRYQNKANEWWFLLLGSGGRQLVTTLGTTQQYISPCEDLCAHRDRVRESVFNAAQSFLEWHKGQQSLVLDEQYSQAYTSLQVSHQGGSLTLEFAQKFREVWPSLRTENREVYLFDTAP